MEPLYSILERVLRDLLQLAPKPFDRGADAGRLPTSEKDLPDVVGSDHGSHAPSDLRVRSAGQLAAEPNPAHLRFHGRFHGEKANTVDLYAP